MKFVLMLIALLAPAAIQAASTQSEDAVFSAMSAELRRSFSRLGHAEKVPLYYMEYEVTDVRQYGLRASNGGLQIEDVDEHERYLDVDARVGSRHLDNTHQIKGPAGWENSGGEHKIRIPTDDDVDALRAALWEETDSAFKAAQERYTKVLTNRAVTAEEENPSDDFSAEGRPVEFSQGVDPAPLDVASLRERIRRL